MRRSFVLLAVVIGVGVDAGATGLSCTLNNAAQNCYQQNQIFFNQTVNWLTGLGEAYGGLQSGAWATSNQAIYVTLTSPASLQRGVDTARFRSRRDERQRPRYFGLCGPFWRAGRADAFVDICRLRNLQ